MNRTRSPVLALFGIMVLIASAPVLGVSGVPDKSPDVQLTAEVLPIEKVDDLPRVYQNLAASLQMADAKATFMVKANVLHVGIANAPTAQIRRISDCPDNSQFHVQSELVKLPHKGAIIDRVVTAWTRYRHRTPTAKLAKIDVQTVDAKKHVFTFDVQLDLDRVSRLE